MITSQIVFVSNIIISDAAWCSSWKEIYRKIAAWVFRKTSGSNKLVFHFFVKLQDEQVNISSITLSRFINFFEKNI